ncbi:TspO/MBR family protein [Erythrobacter ani]|uniref:Tryptophan-rich sensory protein n=1 Tax=Erythrobacter ani TaxID=2827235 RepID=A0ABS6SNX6_9SPHN|nr:TspO/MBR family protein [Erythrobacter ani]MBV7266685.1 tryptophan-rich sensory protein [Erythrobacter ani]
MNILASKEQLRASFLRWALFLVPLIVLLGFISGQLGNPSTQWFQGLTKPAIFPPPAIFGVVWTVLWLMIGFAVALVASAWGARGRGIALIAFALHFLGTLAWTPVFFGLQDMTSALYVLMYAAITLLIVIVLFWKVRRTAALLLVPYFCWVCFAAALNYQFIAENPDGGVDDESGAAVEITL